MNGSTRWRRTALCGDQRLTGWVAGRYLRKAALPSGNERDLDLQAGKLVGSDPGLGFNQERTGDQNRISINGEERYEIPDVVIYGD
ncbi:hypothetical protein [Microbaculum sp. FT89]|uniref:hypothetical protein n=1 Tax=Microbaculum sp. FT89 TaxID=3447298 RepID=UPI003F534FC9